MSEIIHQEVHLPAKPDRVYEALMDSHQHAAFTGNGDARISRETGGAFQAHDGVISGRNIELVPGKRIVQAWRVKDWPAGMYSVVRFELTDHDAGTRLLFDQWGAPAEQREHLAEGWKQRYWRPLETYLLKAN